MIGKPMPGKGKTIVSPVICTTHIKSRYNNGLIAKLMLMWRREERREMIAWLLCKHQAGHGCIGSSGPK